MIVSNFGAGCDCLFNYLTHDSF